MVPHLGLQGRRRALPHPRGGARQGHLAAAVGRRVQQMIKQDNMLVVPAVFSPLR
jgi:hypothetical protein